MSTSRLRFLILLFCSFPLLLTTLVRAEDWLPITPEELKMTAEPKAPGALAIYLYRQVDRDDTEFREYNYARIKILSEEGRKYADVEIPFLKGVGNIKGIQARTIHSDGSIAHFDGKVYERMIVKAKGIKFLAKTFTMPDVQPGSIIEYRYTRTNPDGYISDSRWLLSEELFTKHAKFSLHRNDRFALQWSWPRGLPAGTNPPVEEHHIIRLETQDVPAFQIEDYMPPQDEMKYRVDFLYTRNPEKDPDKFWKEEAKRLYRGIDLFTDKHKAMEQVSRRSSPPQIRPIRSCKRSMPAVRRSATLLLNARGRNRNVTGRNRRTSRVSRTFGNWGTATAGTSPGSSWHWPVLLDWTPVRSWSRPGTSTSSTRRS